MEESAKSFANTFNTNITQWALIEKLLDEKKIHHWSVMNQWERTEYAPHYGKDKPFTMMLLQLPYKFVVIVWGNSKFYKIKPRHSINDIISALTPIKKTSLKI
jgi:hypothetical protein